MAIDKLQQHLNKLKAAPAAKPAAPKTDGNQYYNQYRTEGTTFINPTFGQPNSPNKSNMGQLGSPSSRFKAQVTKDTMKGLSGYNKQSQDINSFMGEASAPFKARQQARQDMAKLERESDTAIRENITNQAPYSGLRPEAVAIGEAMAVPTAPIVGAGLAGTRELLRPGLQMIGLSSGPGPGVLNASRTGALAGLRGTPNALVRGAPIASVAFDTGVRVQDWGRTSDILKGRQEYFDSQIPEVQQQILAQDPNYLSGDDLFQQVRMARGGALIDQFDNAGAIGKTLQGAGLVYAPYQLAAMAEAPNYEMQQALSDSGEVAREFPGALEAQLYGGPYARTIPESSRFDFSQATPQARDAAMRLLSDREARDRMTGFYGTLGRIFLRRPEGAKEDLTQYLRGAVAEGQMTPAQLSTLVDRVGVDIDADRFYDRNMTQKSDGYEARRAEQQRAQRAAAAQRARDAAQSAALRAQSAAAGGNNSLGMSTPMGTGRPSVQQ